MKLWLNRLLVLILFLVTACGVTTTETQVAQPPPPTSTNAPTLEEATHTPAAEPTVAETPLITPESIVEPTPAAIAEMAAEVAPTSENVDWLTIEGKTSDNFTYLGNPDAPITLIDYSDFL